MSDEELRLQAYYYGFSKTGAIPIDVILSAVACAGKSFHLTEDWLNECSSWKHLRGNSPVDWIQNAADDAAQALSARDQRIAELERERDGLIRACEQRDESMERVLDERDEARATLATTQAALDAKEKECERYRDELFAVVDEVAYLGGLNDSTPNAAGGLVSLEPAPHTLVETAITNLKRERDTALRDLATAREERDKAVESIRECRVFLRGCMNHAYDETPIVEVAKDVSEEFHRNRYQIQCMAKERDNAAKERDAANILLRRLMCVVVPDNAVPNDMKEFLRDSAATVLKDLWEYLKSDTDLRMARHEVG